MIEIEILLDQNIKTYKAARRRLNKDLELNEEEREFLLFQLRHEVQYQSSLAELDLY